MTSKKTFEAAARILAEAKMLGLFAEGTAHELVTEQFAKIFEEMNPRFDKGKFIIAAGVTIVVPEEENRAICQNSMIPSNDGFTVSPAWIGRK